MENKQKKIILIDRDTVFYKKVLDVFDMKKFRLKMCGNEKNIKRLLSEFKPDLILLGEGNQSSEVLKKIRNDYDIPVIAAGENLDTFKKVIMLDLGADDYVEKSIHIEELVARINAVLRRYKPEKIEHEDVIEYENLKVDLNSYKVIYKRKEVKMPPRELELLYFLAANPNNIYNRLQLLHEVWGLDDVKDPRTVDVHIKRIRSKIRGSRTWQIETVWGLGYKFNLFE